MQLASIAAVGHHMWVSQLELLHAHFDRLGLLELEAKELEKEREGLLPVRGLSILKADRQGGASPATRA